MQPRVVRAALPSPRRCWGSAAGRPQQHAVPAFCWNLTSLQDGPVRKLGLGFHAPSCFCRQPGLPLTGYLLLMGVPSLRLPAGERLWPALPAAGCRGCVPASHAGASRAPTSGVFSFAEGMCVCPSHSYLAVELSTALQELHVNSPGLCPGDGATSPRSSQLACPKGLGNKLLSPTEEP